VLFHQWCDHVLLPRSSLIVAFLIVGARARPSLVPPAEGRVRRDSQLAEAPAIRRVWKGRRLTSKGAFP
jgi:hypothetical protein